MAFPIFSLGILIPLGNKIGKAQLSEPVKVSNPPSQIPAFPSSTERINDWSRNASNEPLPASISLGNRIPDAQVLQLVRRYNLQIKAVYMSAAGMSGTHRTDRDENAEVVIAEARQRTAEMMQKDLDGSYQRFQDFEKNHPRQQVLSQASQKAHLAGARSLLKSVEESESIIAVAKGGKPLITGLEIVGSVDDIKKLSTDPIIQVFEPAFKFNNKVIVPTPSVIDDQSFQEDIANSVQAIEALSENEVYNRVENRTRRGGR